MKEFKDVLMGNIFAWNGSTYCKDGVRSCFFVSGFIKNNMAKLIKTDAEVTDKNKTYREYLLGNAKKSI